MVVGARSGSSCQARGSGWNPRGESSGHLNSDPFTCRQNRLLRTATDKAQNNNHGSFRPLHSCPQNSCPPNSSRQRQRHTTFRPHHSRFSTTLLALLGGYISSHTGRGLGENHLAVRPSLAYGRTLPRRSRGPCSVAPNIPRGHVASLAQRVTGSALRKSSYQRSSSVGMERDGLVGSCRWDGRCIMHQLGGSSCAKNVP